MLSDPAQARDAARLAELRAEPLRDAGDGEIAEAWWLTLSPAETDAESLGRFLEAAADIRLAQAEAAGLLPATFLAWIDEQAGQVRFTLLRSDAVAGFFSVPQSPIESAREFADAYLTESTGGFIPWSELQSVDGWIDPADDPGPPPDAVAHVWTRERDSA